MRNKLKYLMLSMLLLFIIIYGFIIININVTNTINSSYISDDIDNKDRASIKIYRDNDMGIKYEYKDYIMFFNDKLIRNILNIGVEKVNSIKEVFID